MRPLYGFAIALMAPVLGLASEPGLRAVHRDGEPAAVQRPEDGAGADRAGVRAAVPELVIETTDSEPAAAGRLRLFDTTRLAHVVRLVGLDAPGAPIHVVLAPDGSELGRRTPAWVAGFAHGGSDTVVLFPARAPQYPHDSMEEVLHHEVAHVLIDRAARGRPVPRWFSEGLATVAEGQWGREDRRQLAVALRGRSPLRMQDVDGWFRLGAADAGRAYAVSAAFLRDLLDVHGRDAAARILARVAEGEPFEAAFTRVTGESLLTRERAFDARMTSWDRWVPLLTSQYVLWMAVTALALLAILRRRQKRAAIRRRWDEEEGQEPEERELRSAEPGASDSAEGR